MVLLALATHGTQLAAQTPPVVELEGNRRMPVQRSDPNAENVDLITMRLRQHDIMNPKRMSQAQFDRGRQEITGGCRPGWMGPVASCRWAF
jgi:hypothetical protein